MTRASPSGLAKLSSWFQQSALPAWIERAHDSASGHFHEALALDGTPLSDTRLRTRTAARLIFTYADAARLGVAPQQSLSLSIRAFEVLRRDARLPDGGFCRTFDRVDGTMIDPVMDLYDQSCVLLALAALFQATDQTRYRDEARDLLMSIDRNLAAEGGGWAEDALQTLPRRQNPHMHMFEAFVGLHQARCEEFVRPYLEALLSLLLENLLDERGLLREFFGPHWETGRQWGSERLDPGHMAEWAYLLSAANPLIGDEVASLTEVLTQHALSIGLAVDDPRFLTDEVDETGNTIGSGRRLWSQTEMIKACLATGRIDRADEVALALLETYLIEVPEGLWHDQFDLYGSMVATTVPGSSLYHLWTLVKYLNVDHEELLDM